MPTSTPPAPAALAAVLDYHQRTKHRFEAYASGPGTLDWDAQPAPFRHFQGAPQIALPRLSAVPPGSALHAALQRPFARLDDPQQAPLPPDLASLGALLQLSLGLTAWKSYGPDRWAVRANPSSGNLHPTEAYLLIAGIDALQDGLYHYRPENHALELRAAHPAAGREPSLAILLTSVMWREAWKYGERAFRYCQLDTGHAAGALRYAAAVLGWRLAEQAHVGSDTLARLAGIDRLAEFPARKRAETELEEAEILLAASFCAAPPKPLASTGLQALAEHSTWHGVASTIDRYPMYSWPAIAQVAAATRRADGEAQPATTLPAPAPRAPGEAAKPVQALLGERRSAQRFDRHHVMGQAQLAAILARLQPAGLPWDVFAETPHSALVLFVARVEGLAPGLYLLPRSAAQRDALRPLLAGRFALAPVPGLEPLLQLASLEPLELQRSTRSLHCHQDIASTACFALGMLAAFDAALESGSAAYRSLYREAGLIGQALYLEAEAQGLRGTGIGCFFDDPVRALLGLEDHAWQTLYHFTVGLPVEDPRIESAPAYADGADTLPH
ncbi:SagB family peptide dehydrogenase [Azotobacter beijerinckii]|uniref:SagB-type dehydrogenase domain-containing protein n=1 Tax=Azotobacter beijerinckii TaxID=170623 RepID=A0A1I4B5W7_9GAMM|nr:SagB family peptide dehydrogenase [Azotobacter beijerinckii]SFA90532.1 SagB-type dehydrogenase domain-containing protein [Azotobacter beijerinckii]SFK63256.1 SagB-type dehydrogenase domain-containing protein [Azotobacter beijerinckii]